MDQPIIAHSLHDLPSALPSSSLSDVVDSVCLDASVCDEPLLRDHGRKRVINKVCETQAVLPVGDFRGERYTPDWKVVWEEDYKSKQETDQMTTFQKFWEIGSRVGVPRPPFRFQLPKDPQQGDADYNVLTGCIPKWERDEKARRQDYHRKANQGGHRAPPRAGDEKHNRDRLERQSLGRGSEASRSRPREDAPRGGSGSASLRQ